MKKTNNDRYKHLNASRYAEIQILLKKDLNNYANLTPVEKLNHHDIRLVVSNPDIKVELFTDEEFQKDRVRHLKNPIVKAWWEKTFASM